MTYNTLSKFKKNIVLLKGRKLIFLKIENVVLSLGFLNSRIRIKLIFVEVL